MIFDEIQLVEGWEPFIRRLWVAKKAVVKGSSSRLLSGELSKHLTGRHIDVALFPFSFHEFLVYKGIVVPKAFFTSGRAEVIRLLNDYVVSWGFQNARYW